MTEIRTKKIGKELNKGIGFSIRVYYRHVARWEAGGAAASPDFGGSVNPISTRGDTLSPPSTTCPPGFLTLAACLWVEVKKVKLKRRINKL